MLRRKIGVGLAVLLLVASAAGAVAPAKSGETQAAIDEVKKVAEQVKSFEADQIMDMNMPGMQMKLSGHMIVLSPDFLKMSMKPEGSQQDPQMAQMAGMMNMEIVMDKTTVYVNMLAMNMVHKFDKSVFEQSGGMGGPGGNASSDPSKALDGLDQDTIQLVGTETLDGQVCYVFEGKLPQDQGPAGPPVKVESAKTWIAKKDGIARKTEMYQAGGVPFMTITVSNVNTAVQVTEADFAFTPPPGVQVMDMTPMLKGLQGGPPQPPATE